MTGRIIPARAGFTRIRTAVIDTIRDHPRSRGVYIKKMGAAHPTEGSSPLARGLHDQHKKVAIKARIIPARAGFTSCFEMWHYLNTDHPRSRGVYPPVQRDACDWPGIIPARAGFTGYSPCHYAMCRDHPRSRGVYSEQEHRRAAVLGSSPLARGLQLMCLRTVHQAGIIPARAGFTLADPWNPNDEPHYQTAFAFTADLVLAPQSSDSAVVSQRSTRTPSEA